MCLLARKEIKSNYELVVRYLASKKGAHRYVYRHHNVEWKNRIHQLETRLASEIQSYSRFVNFFLSQLSDAEFGKRSESPVRLLNQGPDTTFVYKKLIAEYLGIPIGDPFQFHVCAWHNLQLLRLKE